MKKIGKKEDMKSKSPVYTKISTIAKKSMNTQAYQNMRNSFISQILSYKNPKFNITVTLADKPF